MQPSEALSASAQVAVALAGIAVTLLQLYNFIRLQVFWPFFAAIATLLVLAMLQFILLVAAGEDKA